MDRISRRREASIARDVSAGILTKTEIARRYGVSRATVTRVAQRNGISRPRNDWTEEEIEFLRANYRELGPRAISLRLKRHPHYGSVCHKAKELGLSTLVGPYGKKRRADADKAEG